MSGSTTSSDASADAAWVLYDADCGLCRFVVARVLELDRARRLRPLALQDPRADELLPHLTEEQRMKSFHVVEPDGTVHSAGPALTALFAELPGGRGLSRLSRRFPGATSRFYWFVADNRDKFGKAIPDAARRQASRRIAERTG